MRRALVLLCALASALAARPAFRGVALGFEENRGQAPPGARFLLRTEDGMVSFSHGGITFAAGLSRATVRMKLAHANPALRLEGERALKGRSHYFAGNDSKRWVTNVPQYAALRYREVYPGIDLVFHTAGEHLQYDWVLRPGADPRRVRMAFEGAVPSIDAGGDLVVRSRALTIRHSRPLAYQDVGSARHRVPVRFKLRGHIAFQLGAYDSSRPLTIDPVLSYSSVFGGTPVPRGLAGALADTGQSIAVDTLGNAYIAGTLYSPDFGALNSPLDRKTGQNGAFVAKLDPQGELIYVAFLASSEAGGIAVGPDGTAYVVGDSGTGFPTAQAFQPLPRGAPDAFITKLSPAGSELVFSTFLGGSSTDRARAVALDDAGNIHVAGWTLSPDFPVSNGAQQRSLSGYSDGFVCKIRGDGSGLMYSTHLGGGGEDEARAIAVDAAGNAFVGGTARSQDFPTTDGAFQRERAGYEDGFVAKLNPTGSALLYSTLLVGAARDRVSGIAVDAAGHAYATGDTNSDDFPTTPGAFERNPGAAGYEDRVDNRLTLQSRFKTFVLRLNQAGSELVYSTYLAGSYTQFPGGIAIDPDGNAYVTGITNSLDFPLANPIQATPGGGRCRLGLSAASFPCFDAYVAKISPDGSSLLFSTYLGGGRLDRGNAIAVSRGAVYITGTAESTDLYLTVPPRQPRGTVLVAKFDQGTDIPAFSAASVGNGASFVSGLTPGALATLFGWNLTSVGGVVTGDGLPLPTEISGVAVTVNGSRAPLLAVANANGRQQINFQVPWEIAGENAEVVVSNNGAASLPVRAPLLRTQPGVFTLDGIHAAAQHGSDYRLVSASDPAWRGEVVVLYATGLGPVQPPVRTGTAAPTDPPAKTVLIPTVRIGGSPAELLFSGLAPGFAGLYQLNVRIPAGAPSGEVEAVVSMAETSSYSVRIFVE